MKHRKPELIKSTLIFSALGIFIPGFTAIVLFGFQALISSFGLKCHNAWTALWVLTIIGGLALPIFFYRHIRNLDAKKFQRLKIRLIYFNLVEYIFLQASLTVFFTNAKTLCYASDGQNGLEFGITAWLALPILIILSIVFQRNLKLKW